ncbi:MAG: glycosyltransferase family 2 protein [Polyangiaceae bacterium]
MLDGVRLAVVVPARNESRFIVEVVETMPAFVDEVLVIDDASEDDTAALARAAGATVISHEVRRGVGAAIVTGYRAALERGAGAIAVMAGDGQMCPRDLEPLARPVTRGVADYSKGDRFRHEDAHVMPRARYFAGRALSALTGRAIGWRELSDSQTGYTVVSAAALRAIELDRVWTGYGYPNDLLGHLARAGARFSQTPVRPVYRGEASGLRPWHLAVITALIGRAYALRWLERASAAQHLTESSTSSPAAHDT